MRLGGFIKTNHKERRSGGPIYRVASPETKLYFDVEKYLINQITSLSDME